MPAGYIYILINPSYGQLLKIGKTCRLPEERAAELSKNTSVPTSFHVAYQEQVVDCDIAEKHIHKRLKPYRVNKGREFFRLPLKDAIQIVSAIANDINRIFNYEYGVYPEGGLPFGKSNHKESSEKKPVYRGGFRRVQGVKIVCGQCGKRYSVTLVRYESYSVCPVCFHADGVNVEWD